MTVDDVYLSFLPLAHILDRIIEEYFFRNGASVGFYHGVNKSLQLGIFRNGCLNQHGLISC